MTKPPSGSGSLAAAMVAAEPPPKLYWMPSEAIWSVRESSLSKAWRRHHSVRSDQGLSPNLIFNPSPPVAVALFAVESAGGKPPKSGGSNISAQVTDSADNVWRKHAARKEITNDVEAEFQVLLAREAVDIVLAEQTFEREVLTHFPANLYLRARKRSIDLSIRIIVGIPN